MRRVLVGVLLAIFMFAAASHVEAQGGGASSTGVIQGRLSDAQAPFCQG